MKRILCLLFVISTLLASCSLAGAKTSARQKYQNFREIPGVTQQEADALEKLLAEKPRLVYGACVSTEAFLSGDGSIGGFSKLFCERMSELFGFEFEYTPCSWNELNEKIMSYEIDFAGDFTATPERLKKFMMTDAIVQRTVKVFTDMNSDSLSVTAKTRPVKCAFLDGSTTYPRIAESWNLPFEPVFIDDQSLVPSLLMSGEIDAFIEEGTLEAGYDEYDFIITEEYYPLTYSPVSLTTANPALEPVISVMQKYLKNGGYYELTELYNKGYKDYWGYKLSKHLTDEEKEYILSHNTDDTAVLMACEVDNYPSCFYNVQEKEFQGVAVDVFDQVADLTGLRFKAGNEPDVQWPELLESLESGKYSVVTELMRTNHRKDRFLWTAEPYSTDNYAMISKVDYPDVDINQILSSKVGLLADSAFAEVFLEWFPSSTNTVIYGSNDEAFAALEKGEVDLLMATQNLLLHLTNYLEKPGYKTNIIFNYSSDSFFGFNSDEEILCSIIDKTQRYIDTYGITEHWKRRVFDYESKMLKDSIPYLIFFAGLLLAALFVVAFLFIKNKQINKNLERLVSKRTNELALQTSTLTTIFESIPDLVFCKDLDLRFTRCNRAFEKHFGCLAENIISKDDVSGIALPVDIAEAFREIDRQVIRDRRPNAAEEIIPSVDGDMRLFETIKIPLMRDDEVIGIMGISRDITQRKAAEETLKLTLDNLDSCVYITELDTEKILFINDKMAMEYGGGDYAGKTCWEAFHGLTERCALCPVVAQLKENAGKDYVWEEQNELTGKYYKNTDSLIKWHNGELVHMRHSVDITDLIRLQQDLESASKAKGDFLSRMSHEIRTPLNAIIGMNAIALNTDDLVKLRHCHDRIDNASRHLLSLINDILDMSKIEADKFELSYNEFDFEKLLMNITNVVNFRAEEKHQNLVVNLNSRVPASIYGDDLRLSQVITNLLTNAVKFTPENGTIVLSIEKIAEDGEDITLRFEVADNGIGISDEQKKRLFTSFEQADGSISRKFGGTGLGLAISKRIVELMGGTIRIESELGKGSKFIFTVKVKIGKEKARNLLSTKINRDNLRILLVDDCPETRDYFKNVMDAHNLPCDVAACGPDALNSIHNCGDKPYNIFFVDWQMPEMDGIELTKRIKQITGDNSVVIMISVADWNNIEKDAVAAGVKQFIPKPLFPSALINTINECMGTESQRAEARALDSAGQLDLSGYTILIAEDVDINREIMSAILEDTGITIDFAENGQEAVSKFTENHDKYSLIFMDIQMPEMDGYAATRIIRAMDLPDAATVPIIAMTANVFREDVDRCLACGMNDHIGKPVEVGVVLEKIEKYYDRTRRV